MNRMEENGRRCLLISQSSPPVAGHQVGSHILQSNVVEATPASHASIAPFLTSLCLTLSHCLSVTPAGCRLSSHADGPSPLFSCDPVASPQSSVLTHVALSASRCSFRFNACGIIACCSVDVFTCKVVGCSSGYCLKLLMLKDLEQSDNSFLSSMGRHDSESPVRRRSPSRKERSPTRYRSRNRSPKRARSRSPEPRSLARDNREKSPEHQRSPPISRSPVRQRSSNRTRSPRSRPSPPTSAAKEKLSSRTRSPKQAQSRSPSPGKRRSSIRVKSPRRARSKSLDSQSLSPRSRRLKRVKAERAAVKGNGIENERNHMRKGERNEEKDSTRDLAVERKDRRSEWDEAGSGSNSLRSRHRRSRSPSGHHNRGERRSRSPVSRGRDEVSGMVLCFIALNSLLERALDSMRTLTDCFSKFMQRRSSRDPEQRNGDSDSIAKMKAVEETLDAKEKQKPSFELSGKLAAETNRVRGVTLLFNEPHDARKPDIRWRLYVFKGGEVLNEPLYVHRQSCYLFGRERRVADIPTDHPSCSKQHAVLQYRQVEEELQDGSMSKQVRPYLMDLGSTNGTSINDNKIEPQRYYQLFEKDTIKFGNSSREYVLLHENSSG
ncbi:SMAD/FHA domain-containing protein [Striga asiatica]|uniref:SMAD/FHA domain-containing protein n=1 Tax=Striga asiatica TaxID=4170 RepID=A0A5A7P3I2_STRAF|nr:SMAD/FHA domain-containing protein [Striga asiatica]